MKKKQLLKKYKKLEEKANDSDIKQQLILNADKLIFEKFADNELDYVNEKRKLVGGHEISISDYRKFIKDKAQKWGSKFKLDYFEQVFRLLGLDVTKAKYYRKPPKVAVFNNEVIYGRFEPYVLPILQERNPYVGYCRREFKHYQFFSIELINLLTKYLSDATDLMKTCTTLREFRKKYYELYKVSFQEELFQE